jgi:GGDEF domain-containing protein
MTRLYYLVIPLLIWFSLLFNIERFTQPINIAPFFYGFVAICAILIVVLPRLHQISLQILFGATLLPYFLLEYYFGHSIGGEFLPVTITEISALGLTIVLSTLTGRRLEELQETLTSLMIGQMSKEIQPFGTGQGLIYREVRRARRHQRPLALLAISAADASLRVSLDEFSYKAPFNRFVEDVQHEIVKKYVFARIANLLIDELEDCAIVTQRDDHFVTILPETAKEDSQAIVRKLEHAAEEKLGIKLRIGMATFPDEEITFEALLERAEAAMMNPKTLNGDLIGANYPTNSKVELMPANGQNPLST